MPGSSSSNIFMNEFTKFWCYIKTKDEIITGKWNFENGLSSEGSSVLTEKNFPDLSNAVYIDTPQSIIGIKTFINPVIVPNAINNNQAINLGQLQSIIVLPNSIISGLALSISGSNVLIQPGIWRINNIIYSTATVTTLPIDIQDASLSRYDSLYVDNSNSIHIVSGVLSATPVSPSIPNLTLPIGNVFITPTAVTVIGPIPGSYMDLTTNQITDGIKTFLKSPIVPTATTSGQAVNFGQLVNFLTASSANSLYPQLSSSYTNPSWITSLSATKISGLAVVATSGNYNDLTGKPSIYTFTGNTSQYTDGTGAYQTFPSLAGYVPTSRTITINGTTLDLTTNRSWTITSSTWGSITGTLSSQTDLNTALNSKLTASNNLSDVSSIDTSRINLGFQTVWNRKGVVLTGTLADEQNNVGEPTVILDNNPQILTASTGQIFKMWYTAGWSVPNIRYAESYDGVTWVKYATPVITSRNRSFVLKYSGSYYMYAANVANTQIDRFTSSDGVNWTLANTAVITSGGWTPNGVYSPYVFVEGGIWKMLLDGNNGNYCEGLYTSSDGITWTSYSGNPVITLNGENPNIIKIGSIYYLYGHGNLTDGLLPTDLYRHSSTDLINWTAPVPVLSRRATDEGPGLPSSQLGDLSLLQVGNSVYMYYIALTQQTPSGKIKLAVANMPFSELVKTSEGDGGDINNPPVPFVVDPVTNNLYYRGGDNSTFTLDAPNNSALIFARGGTPTHSIGEGLNNNGHPDLLIQSTVSPGTITISGYDPAAGYGIQLLGGVNIPGDQKLTMGNTQSYPTFSFGTGASSNIGFFLTYGNGSKTFVMGNTSRINYDGQQDALDALISSNKNITIGSYGIGGGLQDQSKVFTIFDVANRSVLINGGGTYTTDTNLLFQVDSITKGVGFPSMTTTQKNAITSPSEREFLYDNTLHQYQYWNGTSWISIGASSGGTVTSIGITTANGVSGTSSGGATPNLTISLGAITPTSTNGVSAATMAFLDATSSIQTQLNSKALSISGTGYSKWIGTTPSFITSIPDGDISSSTNWNTAYTNRITSLTTTGTSGAATLTGNVLNIPQYTGTIYTAGTGLTLTTGVFSVNTSQNITTLSNLTSTGFVTSTSSGVLGSRTIVAGDIPTLNQNTTGNAATVTTNANLTGDITSVGNATTASSSLVKTVVLNTTGVLYTNPITFTTTAGVATGSLTLATQTANTFLGGATSGGAATPTFRSLVALDIPTTLNATSVSLSSLAATVTPGFTLTNPTAATVSVLQNSPAAVFSAQGWNTTTSASITGTWSIYNNIPNGVTGASQQMIFQSIINGSTTTPFTFMSNGQINMSGGIFTGANSGFSNISAQLLNLSFGATTTSTDGLTLVGSATATSGIPVQYSLRQRFRGVAWNTTTVASNTFDFINELRPITGTSTTISSKLWWASQNNGGGYTDRLSLDNSGNLSLLTGNLNLSTASLFSFNNILPTTNQLPYYNGTAMVWGSVPITQASADLPAQTAAITSVTAYTASASNGTFRIGAYLNITAVTLDVIQVSVTYTDENNTAQTALFYGMGSTSAGLSAIGNSNFGVMDIRVKASTTITVKTTLTTGTGSITYDVGATISQLR